MMRRSLHPLLLLLFLIAPALLIGAVLGYAGDVSDGVRLGYLSLLGCVTFYFAVKRQSKILYTATVLWWLIFWMDALLRTLSWLMFDSDPTAYFIVQAIANTSLEESLEFLQIHTITAISSSLALFGISLIYFYILFKYFHLQKFSAIWHAHFSRYLLIFLCVGMVVCYAIRPARALFPAIYWTNYYHQIQKFQDSIQQHQQLHTAWQHKASTQLALAPDFQAQQTHVLILSESITSLNLGVCGYPRNTTPELAKHLNELQVFCQAYSPYSSTINSLKANLTDSSILHPNEEPHESLLSYAKAAGFRIYWLSNQDDSYISSLFGSLADHTIYHNKRSGRSSSALDEELLPYYLKALNDSYPKKLIILHFIGAHPNYANRYPEQFEQFKEGNGDAVEHDLEQRNIGLWVQLKRNEYDNAILYQDALITQFLTALKQHVATGQRSFTYISDHGNEDGHEIDYAGHSPNTKAGYQVPVILWSNDGKPRQMGVNSSKILDTADLDTNLMHLMRIRDKTDTPHAFWLDKDYQFQPNAAFPYWKKKKSP